MPVTYSYTVTILHLLLRITCCPVLICTCSKVWVTQLLYGHRRTGSWIITLKTPCKQPAQASYIWNLWSWDSTVLCRGHRCHTGVEKELLQRDHSLHLCVKWWIAIQNCENHTEPEIPSLLWENMLYCPPSPHIKSRLTLEIKYSFRSHRR